MFGLFMVKLLKYSNSFPPTGAVADDTIQLCDWWSIIRAMT
jgi:hypothetical protein